MWNAHDPNDDELRYAVYVRGENEREWKLLKDKLDQKFYSWDTTGMPDGDYKRFLNFLATHECCVDFREFRTGKAHMPPPRTTLVPTDAQFDANHGRTPDGMPPGSGFDALLPAVAAGRSRGPTA